MRVHTLFWLLLTFAAETIFANWVSEHRIVARLKCASHGTDWTVFVCVWFGFARFTGALDPFRWLRTTNAVQSSRFCFLCSFQQPTESLQLELITYWMFFGWPPLFVASSHRRSRSGNVILASASGRLPSMHAAAIRCAHTTMHLQGASMRLSTAALSNSTSAQLSTNNWDEFEKTSEVSSKNSISFLLRNCPSIISSFVAHTYKATNSA